MEPHCVRDAAGRGVPVALRVQAVHGQDRPQDRVVGQEQQGAVVQPGLGGQRPGMRPEPRLLVRRIGRLGDTPDLNRVGSPQRDLRYVRRRRHRRLVLWAAVVAAVERRGRDRAGRFAAVRHLDEPPADGPAVAERPHARPQRTPGDRGPEELHVHVMDGQPRRHSGVGGGERHRRDVPPEAAGSAAGRRQHGR
jgi:hypothetical protein